MVAHSTAEKVIAGGAVIALGSFAAQAQDFDGLYGGLSFAKPNGEFDFDPANGYAYSIEGSAAGLFAGYNVVNGGFVFGGELAWSGEMEAADNGSASVNYGTRIDSVLDLRARVGKVFGKTMLYGSLGYSWVDLGATCCGLEAEAKGAAFGVGFETAVGANAFIGGEITRRNLDLSGVIFNNDPITDYLEFDSLTTASIRIGLRF